MALNQESHKIRGDGGRGKAKEVVWVEWGVGDGEGGLLYVGGQWKDFNNSLRKDLVWEVVMGIITVELLFSSIMFPLSWTADEHKGRYFTQIHKEKQSGFNQQLEFRSVLVLVSLSHQLTMISSWSTPAHQPSVRSDCPVSVWLLCVYVVSSCAGVKLWKVSAAEQRCIQELQSAVTKTILETNNKQTWTSSKGSCESFVQ